MSVNLKDKKIVTAAAAAVIAVVIAAIFLLSGNKGNEAGPEVISKRAKISIDESLNTAAPAESSAAPAPANAAQQAASPAPQTKPEVKALAPVPVAAPQAPAQAKPAPSPAVKAEAEPKPEVKKAVEAAPAPVKKVVRTEPVKAAVKEPVKKAVAEAPKKKNEKTKAVAAASVKNTGVKPWAINVASFPSLEEAQSAAGKLKKAGYKTYITHFTKDSVTWHRVRVGFFKTRAEAQKAGKDIKKKLRVDNPWIVKPDSAEMRAHH